MEAIFARAALKKTSSGLRLSHSGQVHHDNRHPTRGGSYYTVDEGGYAVVVIFSGTNPPPVYKALAETIDRALENGEGGAPRASSAPAVGPAIR